MEQGIPQGKKKKAWYPMDTASTLYSALQTEQYSAIYRFSAMMTQPVQPALLQRAVDRVMPRFPGFGVRVRKGLFWNYFEQNTAPGPFVRPDVHDPCQPVRFNQENGWLVRFYYVGARISIEVFHALSDGAGALIFFRTLLAEYLRQCGHEIPVGPGILDIEQPPDSEELEDAYRRNAGTVGSRVKVLGKAYQNRGTAEPFYTFNVTMGFVPVDALKAEAKKYQASITEYLTALLLWVLMKKQEAEKPTRLLPVALAIPINMRAYFPSATLRNFIMTVRPAIDPRLGPYTFAEVVSRVHHYMRLNVNRQDLRAALTGNVRTKQNRLLGLFPNFIKSPIVAMHYYTEGVRPYSGTYTNPGTFAVPPEMQPHIRHMEVILGQANLPRCHCASISYGNIMEITFAGTQVETDVERAFFRFLVQAGIPVRIESNRGDRQPPERN